MKLVYKNLPLRGNKVSHSNRKTKRKFLFNYKTQKIFIRQKKGFVKLKLPVKLIKLLIYKI